MYNSPPAANVWLSTSPCDHQNVSPATVLCGTGAPEVSSGAPSGVEDERSVRTSRASRSAPSTFNCPAPCSRVL